MDIIDAGVKYKPEGRYLYRSIITYLEIPSEDFIHEVGKPYSSTSNDFSGIGKVIRSIGEPMRDAFSSPLNRGTPPVPSTKLTTGLLVENKVGARHALPLQLPTQYLL